jgi:hypothetical protein
MSELTELSSQSYILFPSCISYVLIVYFIVWFGQAVLILVLILVVADCEDEELTCW